MAFTTEIRPLDQINIESNREMMRISVLSENFSTYGVFRTKKKGKLPGMTHPYPQRAYQLLWWSESLLHYKGTDYEIDIKNGEVRIGKETIEADQLRAVGIDYTGVVQPSGFVIEPRDSYSIGGGNIKHYSLFEYDEILKRAIEGRLPEDPKEREDTTKVRVDASRKGQKLHVVIFDWEIGRERWDREAVVIDASRELVEREVLHPFFPS